MRDRLLTLTGEDVENLANVLSHAEARFAIAGDQAKEAWCHDMLEKLAMSADAA